MYVELYSCHNILLLIQAQEQPGTAAHVDARTVINHDHL